MTTPELPSWPPQIDKEQITDLCHRAVDYALSHSIIYRPLPAASSSKAPLDAAIHAPLSLFPSPIPRRLYERVLHLQPLYNDLYSRIAIDDTFLTEVIGGNVIKVDEFQEKLWHIWKTIRAEGRRQRLHLGLVRSDYLLHTEDGSSELQIKQVEINTISSSFGALCTQVGDMHRHLSTAGAYEGMSPLLKEPNMPKNEALTTLTAGLAAGHASYVEKSGAKDAIVLFVVQDGERNAFDQRLIEYELINVHRIRVQRATMQQLHSGASLGGSNQTTLMYAATSKQQAQHISVVYFRAGYAPSEYPSNDEWDTRLLLERSDAIKCPTVALQLAGAKKVQQMLSAPGVLERFVQDEQRGRRWTEDEVHLLRNSFMPMYGLEDDSLGALQIASNAEKAKDYVMKPQREGGGNNIYRGDIPNELARLEQLDREKGVEDVKRRSGYILMKLIEPPNNLGNYLIRSGSEQGVSLAKDVISELGIFGSILFEEGEGEEAVKVRIVHEKSGGHLLRTKGRESDEGGVAVGYSVIDSPLLV